MDFSGFGWESLERYGFRIISQKHDTLTAAPNSCSTAAKKKIEGADSCREILGCPAGSNLRDLIQHIPSHCHKCANPATTRNHRHRYLSTVPSPLRLPGVLAGCSQFRCRQGPTPRPNAVLDACSIAFQRLALPSA